MSAQQIKVDLKRFDVVGAVLGDEVLKRSPLLRALGTGAELVLKAGVARRYPDRVPLFEQGKDGTSLFFVLEGEVRVSAVHESEVVELGTRFRGDLLGEAEALAGQGPRLTTARAFGTVAAVELARASIALPDGRLPRPVEVLLGEIDRKRADTLGEMAAFLSRW